MDDKIKFMLTRKYPLVIEGGYSRFEGLLDSACDAVGPSFWLIAEEASNATLE